MPYKDKEKQKAHNKEYQRKHYKKKTQYYKDKAAERQERIRREFAEFKGELKCSECGESHPACLDFHHIDPKQKKIEISKAVCLGWGIERIKEELKKCIVLCSNCHRKFHHCGIV